MDKHIEWTEKEEKRLIQYRKSGLSQAKTAAKLTQEFNVLITKNAVKHREEKLQNKEKWKTTEKIDYKESVEIQADGTHKSDKLLKMSSEQSKDVNFLLEAHGYNKETWELTSARNNIWNVYSKQDGVQTLYSSKITVKPITDKSFDKLIEVIKSQEPFKIVINKKQVEPSLLEIAPVDTHFGISDYDYYKENQQRIINRIQLRHWDEIVIPIGNDLFHNDDFRGRTSSGREIQKVSMDKAWEDSKRFYYPIIEEALKHSNNTKVIYVKSNHDESMAWAFTDNIKTKFPDIDFDGEFTEHKAHIYKDIFIGYTHGNKNRKDTVKVFNSKYRMEIAKAKVREIHIAHLHGEDSSTKDDYGIMIRTLPTQNKEDEWHDENGYVGNNKRFMCFEYSKDALEGMYYV